MAAANAVRSPVINTQFARVAVNAVRYSLAALVLLTCNLLASVEAVADDDFHPTDAQVKQMQESCEVSDTGMLALEEKVRATVADWRTATADTGPASAMRRLEEFFGRLRSDSALSGRKSMYVLCVEKAVRQFVDAWREKPEPVSESGASSPLQRSAFASEEDIWKNGCRDAEKDAVSKLQSRCGEREFVALGTDCAQLSGDVRTYTAQVEGECRGK